MSAEDPNSGNKSNRNSNQRQQHQHEHLQLPLYTSYDLDAEEAEGAVLREIESRQQERRQHEQQQQRNMGLGFLIPAVGVAATGRDQQQQDEEDNTITMMYHALEDRGGGSSGSGEGNGTSNNNKPAAAAPSTAASGPPLGTAPPTSASKSFKPSLRMAVRKVQTLNAVARTATKVKQQQVAARRYLEDVKSGNSGHGDSERSLLGGVGEGRDGLMKKTKKVGGGFDASCKFDHHLLQIPNDVDVDDGGGGGSVADDGDGSWQQSTSSCARQVCRHPAAILRQILHVLNTSLCIWLAIPLACGAYVLFYYAGNPDLDFLPGSATLSWWMNFSARLCVTLELACFVQYILIDGLLSLATAVAQRRAGSKAHHATATTPPIDPLVTLILLQSRGWPFCLAVWSLLNLLLLQGDNPFQRHWLFFTGWEIYSSDAGGDGDGSGDSSGSSNVANSGDYILESEIYLRLLVSGILVGALVGLKRTYVALYFGAQQLQDFQPRLELILADIVILSEVAILASSAAPSTPPAAEAQGGGTNNQAPSATLIGNNLSDLISGATASAPSTPQTKPRRHRSALPSVDFGAVSAKAGAEDQVNHSSSSEGGSEGEETERRFRGAKAADAESDDDHVSSMKKVLERWEEPTNKRNKSLEKPTINDILRFRRALNFCNAAYPFGKEFGSTSNRDQCIKSSHEVFHRLLELVPMEDRNPDQPCLPFSLLAELAYDDETESEDEAKMNLIMRRFRPDASNNLSLFAFVQSCDSIYKRLRYFKASLDNASVISNVLERVTNAIFFFVLILLVVSVMKINPWNILVPFTSLLVSFSFALGASISKYVEGILLITVRHPYDLGDRIFFSSTEGINPEPNVTSKSWFVEDITLTTTTLRYSRTNEVSTVANWSIASLRIVNCNHSPLATVFIELYMHESIFDNGNLRKFRAALNKYAADRPRIWHSVSFCRHDEFDADSEKVKFAISVRHRNSWQDASRIKTNRADLVRFLHEKSKEMGVHYDEPPPQQIMYYGGALKEGELTDGYKRELLSVQNIRPPKAPVEDPSLPVPYHADTDDQQSPPGGVLT